jgi:hypothetical protein
MDQIAQDQPKVTLNKYSEETSTIAPPFTQKFKLLSNHAYPNPSTIQ